MSGGKGVSYFSLAYFTFFMISRQTFLTKIDGHFFGHWNVNRHFSLGNEQCYTVLWLNCNRTENKSHFYHLSIIENWMVICHNRSDNRIVFSQTVTIQLYSCLTIQFSWPWKTLAATSLNVIALSWTVLSAKKAISQTTQQQVTRWEKIRCLSRNK